VVRSKTSLSSHSRRASPVAAWSLKLRFLPVVLCVFLIPLAGCTKGAPESERFAATRILAQEVAKILKPKSVLVISNPFTRESGRSPEIYAFEKAGVEGLQEGFGSGVKMEVEYPPLKPEVLKDPGSVSVDPGSTTPLSFLVSETSFSEVTQRHPSADVIVSLIGLPLNLANYKEWSQPGSPKFALLLPDWRMIGNKEAIVQAFRSGKLLAAVVRRSVSLNAGSDGEADFGSKYFLVTAANVETLLREQPAAFGLQ